MAESEIVALKIDKMTGIDRAERLSLLRYAAKNLNDHLLIKAVKRGDEFFYQNKNECWDLGRSILIYCGIIIALKEFRFAEQKAMHRKCTDEHIAVMEEVHESKRLMSIRRCSRALKKNLLLEHLPDLIKFQQEGYSLRDMQHYLQQRNIKISRETIRRQLNALQRND